MSCDSVPNSVTAFNAGDALVSSYSVDKTAAKRTSKNRTHDRATMHESTRTNCSYGTQQAVVIVPEKLSLRG